MDSYSLAEQWAIEQMTKEFEGQAPPKYDEEIKLCGFRDCDCIPVVFEIESHKGRWRLSSVTTEGKVKYTWGSVDDLCAYYRFIPKL